jgi:hypothetical protein
MTDIDFNQFFLPEDEAKKLKEEIDRQELNDVIVEIRYEDLENYTVNIMEAVEFSIGEYARLIIQRKFQSLIDQAKHSTVGIDDLIEAKKEMIDKIDGSDIDDEVTAILYGELDRIQKHIKRFRKK